MFGVSTIDLHDSGTFHVYGCSGQLNAFLLPTLLVTFFTWEPVHGAAGPCLPGHASGTDLYKADPVF